MTSNPRRYTFGQETQGQTSTPGVKHQPSLAEVVHKDFFEERPMWPFSCYAPHGGWMTEIGIDKSYEELRYEELRLIKVERQRAIDVIIRTQSALEQARSVMQQYYNEKCGPHRANAGSQLILKRNKVTNNAGFGSAAHYEGPYGPESIGASSRPDVAAEAVGQRVDVANGQFSESNFNGSSGASFDPPPMSSSSDARTSDIGVDRPGLQHTEEDIENQWMAAEFSFIPEQPPPRQYI